MGVKCKQHNVPKTIDHTLLRTFFQQINFQSQGLDDRQIVSVRLR